MMQLVLPIESSYLVICPRCWDCWARIEGQDTSFWCHRYVPCINHPQAKAAYGCLVHGSLIEAAPELIDQIPACLISKEFELTLGSISD